MKTKLIQAIKETIIDLETGRKEYSWSDPTSCNCGLLATNLGIKIDVSVGGNFISSNPPYTRGAICNQSGFAISHVIKELLEAGLTDNDIIELENMSNRAVLKEARIPFNFTSFTGSVKFHLDRSNKDTVLKYFRAWLRLLEREATPQEPEYKLVVTCSPEVKELTLQKVLLS